MNEYMYESYFERWLKYFKIDCYEEAMRQFILAKEYWWEENYDKCEKEINKCVDFIIKN